jgi:hypothetical protein
MQINSLGKPVNSMAGATIISQSDLASIMSNSKLILKKLTQLRCNYKLAEDDFVLWLILFQGEGSQCLVALIFRW